MRQGGRYVKEKGKPMRRVEGTRNAGEPEQPDEDETSLASQPLTPTLSPKGRGSKKEA